MVLLEWPDRAAGFLPPDRLDIAFTLAPQARAEPAQRARSPATALRAARRAHRRDPRTSSPTTGFGEAARSACQGDASTRSYERLHARRPQRHPDELAAPAGRPAGARRQALQRDRASRRGRDAVRRDGARPARSAASRRRRSTRPTSTDGLLHDRGSRRRRRGRPAIRRRRSRSATRPRSMCWSRCTASRCRDALPVAPRRRLPPAALRHRRLPDRGRAAARLVSAAARRHGDRRRPRAGVRRAVARGAAAAPSTRRRPGCCATFIRPTCSGCPSARASRASACSISRTR